MIKLLLLSTVLSFTSFSTAVDTSKSGEWKFVKEEHGVKLYNRTIEGFVNKEIKAVLDIRTDLNKAKAFLHEPLNIEKWMSGCSMSIHKGTDGNVKAYYAIFDAPWPVSDRDDYGVMELKEHTTTKLKIDFESKPKGTPKVTSMVRVPYSKGHISIETNKSGKNVLTYQMLVDRGGNLPHYMKDYLENSSPVKTVGKLKEILEAL